MKEIYDNTLYYRIIRLSVGFLYSKFFRQIEIRGTENIPSGEPIIFAANHQNGLIDPLAILFFQKDPIVFMARADMFKNKLAAKVLRSFKITPIYRIRDGFENLAKNEEQIHEAVNILMKRKQLCLMPEGNHGKKHQLRPLVKGLFRIAYSAEEQLNDEAHVQIVPVGIDYDFYQHAGSDLVVTYGKPIEVKEYINLYKENQASSLNVLRDELAIAMTSLMHDIRSNTHYDIVYRLSCYGTPAYLDFLLEKGVETDATTMAGLRFDARCALGRILDKIDAENPDRIVELDTLCERLNKLPGSPAEVSEWMDNTTPGLYLMVKMILSILLIPGFLLNFPVWFLIRHIRNRIEDTQMHSTFAFALGGILNFILYLSLTLLIAHQTHATAVTTLFAFIFVATYGIVSERIRQTLRLPMRLFLHSFGKRKKIVDQCRVDFQNLKEAIMPILRG